MTGQVNQDGDQDQNLGWRAALPDEWKNHDFVKTYQKPGDFVKSAFEIAQDRDGLKAKRTNSIPNLTDQSTDAEKADYYVAIGRPDKPDDYNIIKPADLPDGIPYDPAFETAFKQFAHANNFSKQQAEEAYKWYYGLVVNGAVKQEADNTKAQTDGINTLKDAWKDKFDGNKKIAEIAFKKFGKDAASLLDEAKIGNIRLGDHPAFLKVFYEIGMQTLDDKALKGEGGQEGPAGDDESQIAAKFYPDMKKK